MKKIENKIVLNIIFLSGLSHAMTNNQQMISSKMFNAISSYNLTQVENLLANNNISLHDCDAWNVACEQHKNFLKRKESLYTKIFFSVGLGTGVLFTLLKKYYAPDDIIAQNNLDNLFYTSLATTCLHGVWTGLSEEYYAIKFKFIRGAIQYKKNQLTNV